MVVFVGWVVFHFEAHVLVSFVLLCSTAPDSHHGV